MTNNPKETFNDQFSNHAALYAKARPMYPPELFSWLANLAEEKDLAWDCATGNGQAAMGLAAHFKTVIATDASQAQLDQAKPHPAIKFKQSMAEDCAAIRNASLDLITVATAAHWFDLDRFYTEVRRTLKPGGLLAIWSYAGNTVNPQVDEIVQDLLNNTLGSSWPIQTRANWQYKYTTLPFPYELITTPVFQCEATWSFDQMIDYINSWSGVRIYRTETGLDPVAAIYTDLRTAWGPAKTLHDCIWNLYLKVGRKPR